MGYVYIHIYVYTVIKGGNMATSEYCTECPLSGTVRCTESNCPQAISDNED